MKLRPFALLMAGVICALALPSCGPQPPDSGAAKKPKPVYELSKEQLSAEATGKRNYQPPGVSGVTTTGKPGDGVKSGGRVMDAVGSFAGVVTGSGLDDAASYATGEAALRAKKQAEAKLKAIQDKSANDANKASSDK